MTAMTSAATEVADKELVITRILDAPRALVFKAWDRARPRGAVVGSTGVRHALL
jgi:hypothetical protein